MVLPCEKSQFQEPDNGFQLLNDLLAVNENISVPEKPYDFIISGFHKLYFDRVDIDEELRKSLTDHQCIFEEEGLRCRLYLKLLGETLQIVRNLTGGKRCWREVLGQSLLFVFAKVLDIWLAPIPNCKW